MEKTNNNVDSIHVKVIYEDEIRRFLFSGTEFTSLKETIARLLNFNDEFVLKYQDDEKDYVTLENQEDLVTALSISPKLLRIALEKKGGAPPPSSTGGGCDQKSNYRKRHGGHHHHQHHRDHPNKNPEWRKQRVEKKTRLDKPMSRRPRRRL